MAIILCVVFILVASIHDCNCDEDLRFASYYGDHMVLQKSPERAVLWGYGPEGAQVTLSLSGGPIKQQTSLVTVTNGIWRVTLDPVEAGGPYIVIAGIQNCTAILTDVLFGDIWLCGGQSNMWFHTSEMFNASDELALAEKYPHVRYFMASLDQSETVQTDLIEVEIPWSVSPDNLQNFSAVCWLFGRYLHKTLQYPIGLVESCWGGTPVEVWSSPRALQKCGLLEQTYSSSLSQRTQEELAYINCTVAAANTSQITSNTSQITSNTSIPHNPKNNSVLWNAMIHPLLNMTIKGAIWYQGEANAAYHQNNYSCSFPAMIDDWRMAFHEGSGGQTALDFPFGFVQLSTNLKNCTSDAYPNIRWHQTADYGYVPNSRMKKTFMAVALDLPDEESPLGAIHPRDKQDVAYRLTLGARAVAYNEKNVSFQGPFPSKILSTHNYVNVTYDQKVSVTPSKDFNLSNNQTIFEVCCSVTHTPCGPKSRWVSAPIMQWDSTSVQLSASLCLPTEDVAALRYAWRDWPCDFKACPIYSASGILPAPPFIVNRDGALGRSPIWGV